MTLLPCKFCASAPRVFYYIDRRVSIFCPNTDHKCKLPPMVEGKSRDEATQKWNTQFGVKDEV